MLKVDDKTYDLIIQSVIDEIYESENGKFHACYEFPCETTEVIIEGKFDIRIYRFGLRAEKSAKVTFTNIYFNKLEEPANEYEINFEYVKEQVEDAFFKYV